MWFALFSAFAGEAAWASEGPWITPSRTHDVYVGGFVETFNTWNVDINDKALEIDFSPEPFSYAGVFQMGTKVFWRVGVNPKVDLALDFPLQSTWLYSGAYDSVAQKLEDPLWEVSRGIGMVKGRVRYRVLNEADGTPVSVALRLEARTGIYHLDQVEKLTSIGTGLTGVGGGVSVGRMGLSRLGFYTVQSDLNGYVRSLEGFIDYPELPNYELTWSGQANLGLHPRFGVGLLWDGFWRPRGQQTFDWDGRVNGLYFALAHGSQFKVGGQVILFAHGRWPTFHVTSLYTVEGINAPISSISLYLGMSKSFQRGGP